MFESAYRTLSAGAFMDLLDEREAELVEDWRERERQDRLVPQIHGPIEPVRVDLILTLLKRLGSELRAYEKTGAAEPLAPTQYAAADRVVAQLRARQLVGQSLAGSLAAVQHFRGALLGLLAKTGCVLDPTCQALVHAVIDEAVLTVVLAIHQAPSGPAPTGEESAR
ncbi:MAG: hypothetical protein HY909_15860 [Deltaproteobacteria bacterium]|nr:hypothetical protein [Deltaproteobacteria bacterium]